MIPSPESITDPLATTLAQLQMFYFNELMTCHQLTRWSLLCNLVGWNDIYCKSKRFYCILLLLFSGLFCFSMIEQPGFSYCFCVNRWCRWSPWLRSIFVQTHKRGQRIIHRDSWGKWTQTPGKACLALRKRGYTRSGNANLFWLEKSSWWSVSLGSWPWQKP